jgi:uncharacterized membrane protein (DUF106 family)
MLRNITLLFSILTVAFVGLLYFSTSAFATTDCRNLKGCERKFCEIEQQLVVAQQHGDKRKAEGLRISLKKAKKYCTDEGLRADLVADIEEVEGEITEYEADLLKAEEYGKTDKIRKFQQKLEEEKLKLARLEAELAELHVKPDLNIH